MTSKSDGDSIRVSAGGLISLQLDGRLLVEINKNRGDVLTPVGGAIEFYEESREFLTRIGADFEKGNDLRLNLPMSSLQEFKTWFRKRIGREISPAREMHEELIEEHGLDIPPALLAESEFQYLWIAETTQKTSRRGQEDVLTAYHFEIFRLTPSPQLAAALLRALPGAARLRLLTVAEVQKGFSDGQIAVADSVGFLLRPSPAAPSDSTAQ